MVDIRRQERHLNETVELVQELCLITVSGVGHVAAVRLDIEALGRERPVLLRGRVLEAIHLMSASLEEAAQVMDLVVCDSPMPRLDGGCLALDKIQMDTEAALAERWSSGDVPPDWWAERLETDPRARRFLARMELIFGAGLHPEQDIESDLGGSSIDVVKLVTVAEQEFGARLPSEDVWRLRKVKDWVGHVASSRGADEAQSGGRADLRMASLVRSPASMTLEERFPNPRTALLSLKFRAAQLFLKVSANICHDIELIRADRLPLEGPAILAPNHLSLIDSLLCYPIFPMQLLEDLYVVAFGQYFQGPRTSWMTDAGRLIHTGGADMILDTLRHGFQVLEAGRLLMLFPEGVRSYRPDFGPMEPKLGVGILACEAQAPIIPILFDGTEAAYSPRQPSFARCRVRVIVGEAIAPAPRAAGEVGYKKMADAWLGAIESMRAELD